MNDIQNMRLQAALIHAMRMRGNVAVWRYAIHFQHATHAHSTDQRCMDPLFFQTHIFAVLSRGWGYAKCFFSQSSNPNKLIIEHNVLHYCVLKGCTRIVNRKKTVRKQKCFIRKVSNFGGGGSARIPSSPTSLIRMGSYLNTMFSINACLKDVKGL